MVCAIERIRFYLFAFNLFYLLYGVGLLILGILAPNAYLDHFPDQEDDVGSIGIGIITFGASVLAITVVGYYGTAKKSYYMVLTYAVLLLATLIFEVILLYLAFRIYDDMINYDVKLTNDDFEIYFPDYWTKEQARDNVDFDQSKYSCCGSTGPSDFERLSENKTIPWSCCGSDRNVACNMTTAYQIGCPLAYTNLVLVTSRVTYKSASWVFGLLSAGLAVAVLVAAYCAIHLANTIKNARREYRA